jgi:hypothetical protein
MKKNYQAPLLIDHGDVEKITLGPGRHFWDDRYDDGISGPFSRHRHRTGSR